MIKNESNLAIDILQDVKAYIIKHSESSSSSEQFKVKKQQIIGCVKKIRDRMLELSAPDPDPEGPETIGVSPEEMIVRDMPGA